MVYIALIFSIQLENEIWNIMRWIKKIIMKTNIYRIYDYIFFYSMKLKFDFDSRYTNNAIEFRKKSFLI